MDIDPDMKSALRRYQIIAYVVSVCLIVLMFVAVPLNHLAGYPQLSAVISPVHGLGYMIYLALGFDLARRADWPLWPRMVGLLLGGTVPVASIFVERWVTRTILAEAKPSGESEAPATAEPGQA
ncbi:MAG TPA: DUF3817 domain-containing protein [Candidatus Stackebrandtia excrementipullorum]|nr:DUF3817 domain-containing protein [Candidatus Stackebrandtia excrementipullorum]